ncbi:MAG: hypothetical protein HQK50_06015 [Oligoflexia bacterium]|nr:hypothetical protein [Oligoflexia bacterium]MBF0365106.1 hypothetical protein [Oligoflexia bacterium]
MSNFRLKSILAALLLATTSLAMATEAPNEGDSSEAPLNFNLSGNGSEGFYYDSERQKYFSNEKSIFSIKPIGQQKYLDRIDVSIDGGEFVPYHGILVFDKEGPHQIRFRAVDPVLNWSPIQTFRIFVDKTPPKGQVVWKGPTFKSPEGIFVNALTELTVLSQDNLSGVSKIFWSDKSKSSIFPGQQTFSKEGSYEYTFYGVDYVGNQEQPYTVKFFVDTTEPNTDVALNGLSYKAKDTKGVFVNLGTNLELKSHDQHSGIQRIEYQVNDGPVAIYGGPIILSGKETNIRYRAIDNVGNTEKWNSVKLILDIKPPRIDVEKRGNAVTLGGKIYAKNGFKLNVGVNDDDSGIKEYLVSYDGIKYATTETKDFTFDKSGEFQFSFKAVDNVGNLEESNPYIIVIDNTAPEVKLNSTEKLVERDGVFLSAIPNKIYFDIKDDGVGPDKIEISYDGERFSTLTSPIELAEWKNNHQTIHYRGVDRLGNVGPIKKTEILVRTQGPAVDLFVESDKLPNVPLSTIREKFNAGKKSKDESNLSSSSSTKSSEESATTSSEEKPKKSKKKKNKSEDKRSESNKEKGQE